MLRRVEEMKRRTRKKRQVMMKVKRTKNPNLKKKPKVTLKRNLKMRHCLKKKEDFSKLKPE
jgi:amino acid permease